MEMLDKVMSIFSAISDKDILRFASITSRLTMIGIG
jgi:hypothetical protein